MNAPHLADSDPYRLKTGVSSPFRSSSRGLLVTRIFRRLLSFQGVLWTLTIAIVLFLVAFPLLRNLWASYTWERVPCHLSPEGLFPPDQRKYFFQYDGVSYTCQFRNFWDSSNIAAWNVSAWRSLGTVPLGPPNAFCYISPGNPPSAVLNLDTHKRLDLAAPRLGITALLVAAAALMSRAARKHRSPAASDPAKAA
jgi:hypothetical protein